METRTELRKEMQRLAKRFLNIADKLNEKVSNYLDGSGFYVDYKAYTEVKNAEADFLAIYNQIYEEGIKPALNYEIAESVLDGYEEENNTPEDNTCTDKNDSSDIDYTDPKAINQAVLEKLYVIGQEVFDKYVHVNKEGSYTALHLHNEKNAMGEPIRVSFSENPEYTVQVGPFRCKFPANFVFKLINRFEKLNNMGNKKMKVFTYGENPAEIVSAPCVYLDKNGNYNKAKKRVRKLSDKVSVLKLSKDSYRVMFLVFGVWYQIIDEYDENRIKWLLESLSENPDFVKEAVARYELYQEVPYSAVAREMNQAFRSEPDQAVESKDNVSHSPAYGDSETSQIQTNDSGLVRGQKIYAIGANNTKQIYAVLDPGNRTCVEVGDPNNINEWVLERYFRPLQRFRPNIQPASNRNGIGFYYAENEPIYSEMDLKRFCERADKIEAMKKNLEEEKRIQSEKNKADLLDKYPYLKRPEYPCDYKSIMYNLRSVLKHEFPDTSFSVRRDSRDNAIIRWEDGPDEKDVLRVASLFEGKTFHAETDYEDFVYTDFISLFGSLGYIFTERTETEIIQPKTEIIQPKTEIIQPEMETIQPEKETIRQETEIKGNRFYTDIREDYAPFPYVVVDRLDGSVWFFTDSEDEAKDWAADYNQEYSDGGKRKKHPDVEHEVTRTGLAKCAG